MKRFLALVTLFGAALVAAAAPAVHSDRRVAIANYQFSPATIVVTPGTRITWTNHDDDPHTVTANAGAFDSKGLGNGDSFSYVFSRPGRYPYHCSAHPFMKGTVVVKEAKP